MGENLNSTISSRLTLLLHRTFIFLAFYILHNCIKLECTLYRYIKYNNDISFQGFKVVLFKWYLNWYFRSYLFLDKRLSPSSPFKLKKNYFYLLQGALTLWCLILTEYYPCRACFKLTCLINHPFKSWTKDNYLI